MARETFRTVKFRPESLIRIKQLAAVVAGMMKKRED